MPLSSNPSPTKKKKQKNPRNNNKKKCRLWVPLQAYNQNLHFNMVPKDSYVCTPKCEKSSSETFTCFSTLLHFQPSHLQT
jgi:hypothetical protein